MRECPFCANSKLAVVAVGHDPAMLAVKCNECGAVGPSSRPEPEHR